jgi:hypothetical protein
MRNTAKFFATALLALALPAVISAQMVASNAPVGIDSGPPRMADPADTQTIGARPPAYVVRPAEIQHYRPVDQRGINVFEAPKEAGVEYTGFKLNFGAAFTQQFQSLDHSNTAAPVLDAGVNTNELIEIGSGFNNEGANLYINAQVARGIRVAMTSYLSSRHHNETWVKDGYLLIDDSPFAIPVLENVMKFTTVKFGHFEINYGDAHFRRTDNGNAMYNPFVGNYIMDAFTTEIGAEVYLRSRGVLAMASVTGGEIRGNVTSPDDRGPSFIGKLGFDRQMTQDLRVRLTGSAYSSRKSAGNTLYGGDRAGSRYFYVMENTQAKEAVQFTSGLINPGFRYKVNAFVVNPFVKFRGLELFGLAERATGREKAETEERTWNQLAADAVLRLLPGEKLFVGARYNRASGELAGFIGNDAEVNRTAFGAGWFITPNILMKTELVTQKYTNFPSTDIRNGGKFDGFVIEGVVAF